MCANHSYFQHRFEFSVPTLNAGNSSSSNGSHLLNHNCQNKSKQSMMNNAFLFKDLKTSKAAKKQVQKFEKVILPPEN
jgi:hypothetical protein